MRDGGYKLGLSDLLDQNLSSYEYFYSLPKKIQDDIREQDLGSFEDIQEYVASLGRDGTII